MLFSRACERVIVGDLYCDIPLGLYVIRGENVVLIGELDLEREELPPHMTRVSAAEIRRAQKAEREAKDLKGSVHEYRGERFVAKGNAFVVHGGSEGIYSSKPGNFNETESSAIPANGDSYIRFEKIVFRRTEEFSNFTSGLVQAIVFEVEDRETIGVQPMEVKELSAAGQISLNWVTKTGMYNLYFMHCDPNLKGVVVEGKTIWKNPAGYLPGRMAPLMNFYGFMSLAFVILGVFWFYQYARYWREVFPLLNCITLVITLGMFEMALWYFDYAEFNETGVRPTGITIWAVTFGGLTSKVIMLGATFFLASEVLELVENAGAVSDLSGKARLFLVLPVALLDAFFIIWIFKSLSATLNKLQARRMMVKLDIYRKFTNALAVSVIVSVGWICYELYFKSNDVYNEHWQNAWVIPAFWQVLSFSLLCIICALWAPSQNSMRYAYSDDVGEEFERDDSSLTLIKPSSMPSKDVRSASAARPVHTNNVASNGDVEEDKTE
ncbi:hypothetical protein GH714_036428 [Hevea brasiliensis]|uniref:GOST seven transmembrane domain-containing protein n=1 Tax=Hevea brasiliensis TaxID=3981 RepID=A0A6A6NES5_HEVBR|nr:hypothetical protein GH714_036428 [Hevea brasiliensis]